MNGWDAYRPFVPQTPISKKLLNSIPNKVMKWLELLNQPECGEYGLISWNWTPDGGTLLYDREGNLIQLWWHEIEATAGTDKRFEDIENNLEWFTTVEKNIYDELEKLQKEVYDRTSPYRFFEEAARNLQTPETEVVQSEEPRD